ncbi:hypothetical protein PybrP1_006614 [[Pythium] brassicae (nom. inval.)]|nr:hypothetical protein PybrP1_006614 [[Pythium] brassicae (nom. inval.)]
MTAACLSVIHAFGKVSRLKVNLATSVVVHLAQHVALDSIPVIRHDATCRYLGVQEFANA